MGVVLWMVLWMWWYEGGGMGVLVKGWCYGCCHGCGDIGMVVGGGGMWEGGGSMCGGSMGGGMGVVVWV